MLEGIGFGHAPRASWACHPDLSRGRLIAEARSPTRTEFQRDRDRIIHTTAFRRLKHKTQVFLSQDGDHYRTRLTHSIEVGQIARGMARALRLDEDLTEAIALVHDFGHTPFGHAGERALNRALADVGGFDHNAQSLKIVTSLEHCYAAFDGLNLTFETLEGLVKHNGPIDPAKAPRTIADFDRAFPLDLARHAPLEAQCAALADDIAYHAHDIDDGLRSGLITLDQLDDAPLTSQLKAEVAALHPALERGRLAYEIVRRQITIMVEDAITQAVSAINALGVQTPDDIRGAGRTVIAFSPPMQEKAAGLKSFLFRTLYRNDEVMAKMTAAERVVMELVEAFRDDPRRMPPLWHDRHAAASEADKLVVVGDFIAGMTDTYAVRTHGALFDRTPELG